MPASFTPKFTQSFPSQDKNSFSFGLPHFIAQQQQVLPIQQNQKDISFDHTQLSDALVLQKQPSEFNPSFLTQDSSFGSINGYLKLDLLFLILVYFLCIF